MLHRRHFGTKVTVSDLPAQPVLPKIISWLFLRPLWDHSKPMYCTCEADRGENVAADASDLLL